MKSILTNTLLIVVIVSGTAIIPLVGGASIGLEPFKTIFLAFVSAIIALQVVPAMMLLWCFVKKLVINTQNQES